MSERQCPQCHHPVRRVTLSPGSLFNVDQWARLKAGDWYCPVCPGNGRGQDPAVTYWWDHEVRTASSMEGMTRMDAHMKRLAGLGAAVEDTYGIRTAEEWQEWVRLYGTPTRTP